MKILQLAAENLKRLKVVDITPTKDFVLITGANGSGKSSVLDSIWFLLAGQGAICDRPVRDGQEEAHVMAKLGDSADKVELIVERHFTADGTTALSIRDTEGGKFKSPQTMLDGLIGALAFDPLAFSHAKPRDQFGTLRKVAGIKLDLDALARQDKADIDHRRDINRDVKTMEAQAAAIVVLHDAPDQPVDTAKLMAELEAVTRHNRQVDAANAKLAALKDEDAKTTAAIERLQKRQVEVRAECVKLVIDPIKDDAPIKAQLAGAEATNRQAANKKRKTELEAEIKHKVAQAQTINDKIAQRVAQREEALRTAKLPIPGLGFGDDCVTLGGIPFDQASSSEQLRTSIAIAMAMNPKLRIIRCKDGSLLDDNGLRMLQEMAQAADYQVWCERVSTDGTVGIFMEDGTVKANNLPPVTANGSMVAAVAQPVAALDDL